MDVSRRDRAGARGVGLGVGGRLRQRLARMLLHSSCATTSATAFVSLASANVSAAAASSLEPLPLPPPPPPRCSKAVGGRCQRRYRRHGSARALVHISVDCSARSVGAAVLPAPVPARGAGAVRSGARKGKANGNGGKKPRPPPLHSWSSSTDTDDGDLAPFSSEEADEARSTLVSSRSFSSDSTSDFYCSANGPRRHRRPPRRAFRPPPPAPAAGNTNRHGKEKRPLDGSRDGGGAGGTAVVKRSVDPYADFRSSMAEMVAGRRIRGADALSELLARYLALNAPRHHPAILAAFEDVWEAILGDDEP